MKPYAMKIKTDTSNLAMLRIAGVLNRFQVQVQSIVSTNAASHGEVTVVFDCESKVAERVLQKTRRFTEVWDAHIHESQEFGSHARQANSE